MAPGTDTSRHRTAKRATKSKAERSRSEHLDGKLGLELWGIALLAMAGVCAVSIVRGPEGRIGGAVAGALVALLGKGAFVMPVLWALTGTLMLVRRTGYLAAVRLAGLAAAGLALLIALELGEHAATGGEMGLGQYLGDLSHAGGGGWLGGVGAWAVVRLFGLTGSAIVLVGMGIAGLSVSTNVPVFVAASFIWRVVSAAVKWIAARLRAVYDSIVLNVFEVHHDDAVERSRADGAGEGAGATGRSVAGRRREAAGVGFGEPAASSGDAGASGPLAGPAGSRVGVAVGDGADSADPLSRAARAATTGSAGAADLDSTGAHAGTISRQAPGERGRAHRSGSALEAGGADAVAAARVEQLKLIDDSAMRALPPLSLLKVPLRRRSKREQSDPSDLARMLEDTLASFGVEARVVGVSQGPVVTRFEVQPGVGVKVSRIVNLADDLSLAFAAAGVRIEAPIPGKAAIGIEVPGSDRGTVYLREVLESEEFQRPESRLTIGLGKDIAGAAVVGDLSKMLHLLVAGATGSGKSVCLNSIICSILFKAAPSEVRLLMIDPKRVELSVYDGIPHLLAPVVTDPKKASGFLRWVVEEMEGRYKLFQLAGARNISQYNEMVESGSLDAFLELEDEDSAAGGPGGLGGGARSSGSDRGERNDVGPRRAEAEPAEGKLPAAKPLPYIVVIVDELADLMMVAQNEVEDSIARLAFMARAAGIHLILATQRPSVDIVTGVIKANIPSRIAFAVSSQVDSRIILDSSGAERLLGKGDMLFHPIGLPKPVRVQGAFISDEEVAALVAHLKNTGRPVYEAESVETQGRSSEGIAEDDELFPDASRLVVQSGEASISKVQRRFRVGYARAARLIDTMEVMGIVGPSEGSKARKVLMSEAELEELLSR